MGIKKGKIYLCLNWDGVLLYPGKLYMTDIYGRLINSSDLIIPMINLKDGSFTDKVVVNCNTQADWDYVTEKLGYEWSNGNWNEYLGNTCISLNYNGYSRITFYKRQDYHIISIDKFKELFPEKEGKKEIQVKFKKEKETKKVKNSRNNEFVQIINGVFWIYTIFYCIGVIICRIEYGISLTIAYLFYLFILFIIVSALYLKWKSLIK